MIARIARLSLVLIIAFAVIWALVLGWWKSIDHTPSGTDTLLYLVALPLALFGGLVLLRGFIDGLRQAPAQTPDDEGVSEPVSDDHADAADRAFELVVLYGKALTAAGESAAEVLASARESKNPQPDKTLTNDEGFPVFTVRVDRLEVDTVAETLPETDDRPASEMLRTLALTDALVPDALSQVLALLEGAGDDTTLRVIWVVPETWSDAETALAEHWLKTTHLAEAPDGRTRLAIHRASDDTTVFQLIDDLIVAINRDQRHEVCLLMATASHLGEATVQTWQARGELFAPQTPHGQVPGEAAAAIVLADAATGASSEIDAPPRIHRIHRVRRDKSADAKGKISSATIKTLIDSLLHVHDVDPAAVAALVADADLRPSRQTEILGAIDDGFEALEPGESCVSIGAACGSASPAGALIALLCAADEVSTHGAPALALSAQHPHMRAAALLQPAPVPPTPTETQT